MHTVSRIHGIAGILAATLTIIGTTNSLARAENLLTNGSFEQGAFGSPPNGFTSLTPGSTAITGWTVFNDQIAWGTTPNFTPITAQDGVKFLDLQDPGATPAPYGGVTQVISTANGQLYRLTFQTGALEDTSFDPDLGGPVTIRATAGATSMDFVLAPPTNSGMQWMSFDLDFTATSGSTAISLLGISGENFLGIDNASVTAVPEPGTVSLFAFGAVGVLGWLILKRRSRHAQPCAAARG
jgi:hypothetical protein